MQNYIQSAIVAFQDYINPIYKEKFESFIDKTKGLDRSGDENVFKSLQARHLDDFSSIMKKAATDLMNQYYSAENSEVLRRELTNVISYYLHEFLLKTESAT